MSTEKEAEVCHTLIKLCGLHHILGCLLVTHGLSIGSLLVHCLLNGGDVFLFGCNNFG